MNTGEQSNKSVKRTRAPSRYNLFVKEAILSMKGSEILPKDKLKKASQMWREEKEKPLEVEVDETPEPVVVLKKKTSRKKPV